MKLSSHAESRLNQRNIRYEDVYLVYLYGKRIHCAGAVIVCMIDKTMPPDITPHKRGQLRGLTVLLCKECEQSVITVYRNEKALRTVQKKPKYSLKHTEYCPHCAGSQVA